VRFLAEGEIMSETRRQIFKTSVMSALGVLTASALAGCEQPFVRTDGRTGETPAVVVGYLSDPNGKKDWYIFKYDGSGYFVSRLLNPNKLPTLTPSIAPFDTVSWNAGLQAGDVTDAGTVTLSAPGIPDLKVVKNYLTNPNVLTTYNSTPSLPKWNEIGKQ
jgi:hypothetical protein